MKLTIAEKDPEALLQDVAATVAQAQQMHGWDKGAPPPPVTVVKGGAGAVVVVAAAAAGSPKAAAWQTPHQTPHPEPLPEGAAAWQMPHQTPHPEPLPEGWVERTTEDGHAYYDHVPSGSTQWERPT